MEMEDGPRLAMDRIESREGPIGVFLAVPILIAFEIAVDREERLKALRPINPGLQHRSEHNSLEEGRGVRAVCT
jgi:hypothetical protein